MGGVKSLEFKLPEALMPVWLLVSNLSLEPIIKKDNERIKETFPPAETGVQPAENVSWFDLH